LKILINADQKLLERYSKIAAIEFVSIENSDTTDAVAVAVQGDSFKSDLEKALKLDIPVIAIAGLINSTEQQYAIELGVPGEAVIVKDDDSIRNLTGQKFATGKGVTLKDIVTISKYVFDNDIRPEIYIWKAPREEPKATEIKKPKDIVKDVVSLKPKNMPPRTDSFENFIKQHSKIIAIFKAADDADSSSVAKALAEKGHIHLELSEKPRSYNNYSASTGEAVSSGKYAYCNGQEVVYPGQYTDFSTLVLEVDPSPLINKLVINVLDRINILVQVTGQYEESKRAIDAWIEMKLPLHGIIAGDNERIFRKEYGSLVTSIDNIFLKLN
jgi:hypothetical protein